MNPLPIIRPVFGAEELEYLRRCLESGHVTQGPFVADFERRFAAWQGSAHALAVTSGTTALHLALLALDVGPGDEVLVPSFTFAATANAVEYTGARPVFVDVDPATFNMDMGHAVSYVTSRTKTIMPVHQFGLCADMDAVAMLADRHSLSVVEDAACAAGSACKGSNAGTMGDIACFSFHPRKVITTGEGGMATTDNAGLAARMGILRNHGASPVVGASHPWTMPAYDTCGYNFRMSDIQAAVGCAQMDKIDVILAERARIASLYSKALTGVASIVIPTVPPGYRHSWQSYVIRFPAGMQARNNAAERMAKAGIQTRSGTHAVHRLGYYAKKYGITVESCPNAALCEDTSLALPVVHGMTEDDVARVADMLSETE